MSDVTHMVKVGRSAGGILGMRLEATLMKPSSRGSQTT